MHIKDGLTRTIGLGFSNNGILNQESHMINSKFLE